jgi:hypothetical protein
MAWDASSHGLCVGLRGMGGGGDGVGEGVERENGERSFVRVGLLKTLTHLGCS